ncbi:hypothetical protein AQJ66_35650 [Streptomyces bungoensis]|uniref:Uncharacterized protein n=1 Tax=Streptomyces bungoensis TaxID=285568 RepID=A0A101SKM4_9ACTN|nr:hypothetical protein AQJ66_35650 [Streptomyces bungoensis]
MGELMIGRSLRRTESGDAQCFTQLRGVATGEVEQRVDLGNAELQARLRPVQVAGWKPLPPSRE